MIFLIYYGFIFLAGVAGGERAGGANHEAVTRSTSEKSDYIARWNTSETLTTLPPMSPSSWNSASPLERVSPTASPENSNLTEHHHKLREKKKRNKKLKKQNRKRKRKQMRKRKRQRKRNHRKNVTSFEPPSDSVSVLDGEISETKEIKRKRRQRKRERKGDKARKEESRTDGETEQALEGDAIRKGKRMPRKYQRMTSRKGKRLGGAPMPRWKRLSHQPRHIFHRRRAGRAHRRPLFNHHQDWLRTIHNQHENIALSMRNRLHDHIEKTRRQWVNGINPYKHLPKNFPSFPEIPEKIHPPVFPPRPPSFAPSFKHKKNTVRPLVPRKPVAPSNFVPTYRKIYTHKEDNWKNKITTPAPVPAITFKTTTAQKHFPATRTLTKATETTTPISEVENTTFQKDNGSPNYDDLNSVFPETSEEIPNDNTTLHTPKPTYVYTPEPKPTTTTTTTSTTTTEPPKHDWNAKSNASNEVEAVTYIPYGNDVLKGTPPISPKNKHERDWEWVTVDASKNDVNYEEDDEEREGGKEGGGVGGEGRGRERETEEDEKEEPRTRHDEEEDGEREQERGGGEEGGEDGREGEAGAGSGAGPGPGPGAGAGAGAGAGVGPGAGPGAGAGEEETSFDVDQCLECPPKRRIHAPKGQDCAPLMIPTPKDSCLRRNVLRYHVEMRPGNPEPGVLLGEGHHLINVSILGGADGKTPLKSCIYDYEVQVFKCPSLPYVSGGRVECSAGQAWGSKCVWKCDPGKKIIGHSAITCGGHKKSPTWSRESPICEDTGCKIPKGLEGVALSCTLPIPHESLGERLKSLKLYPEGSTCQVRCNTGLTTHEENSKAVTVSECLSTGKWLPDISTCCTKKKLLPPKPVYRDCPDINVQISGPGTVHLIPPRFLGANGQLAHVWCDKDTVRHEGRHCRTCKARDILRGVTASCQQCINVSSRLGCPSIQAPPKGSLECQNTSEGDILCKITCREGFLLPPFISSGQVRCPRGMSLWDFQSYRGEKLPPCVIR